MTYTIKHNGVPVGVIKTLTGLAARNGRWYWQVEMPRAIRNGFHTTLANAKCASANTVQWYSRERSFGEILAPRETPQGVTFERMAAAR